MKVATYDIPTDACGKQFDSALSLGTSWAQFGDKVLLYADDTAWEEITQRTERSALQLQEHPATVNRAHLHVVVQNGRLFQQEQPDIPVIVDRGRILLVELEPDRVRQLEEKSTTCYGILPLGENQVVFAVQDMATRRATRVDWIENLVNRVAHSSLETDLRYLVAFPTRHSLSDHYANAATWARDQLAALNLTARLQNITVNDSPSWNVIADKMGNAADNTRQVVLVTAHLDSINTQGGPMAPAPGADDNGSGSAGLLEMARAFSAHRGEHDLRFILFGGEEEGLFGSKEYVASLPTSEKRRIRAVLNMDMIATLNTSTRSVMLEGAPLSQGVIDGLVEAAATYTDLTVETSLNPFASDHVPFINAGIQAVLTIEGADSTNSNIHSINDTLEHINYDLALEILRMNVAFVANEIGQASPGHV
jgi:Zn-dependent M28 family amino/carboxypeptidase